MATYYTNWLESNSTSPNDVGSMGLSLDWRFRFTVTESVDAANNTSIFKVVKQVCLYAHGTGLVGTSAGSVKAGARMPSSSSYNYSYKTLNYTENQTWQTVGTSNFTIPHNADGTGTVTFQGSGTGAPVGTPRTRTVSRTITMTPINRLSTVSTNATPNTSIGDTVTITITQVATGASYTHNLYYRIGTSNEILIQQGVSAGSINFTVPNSILDWSNDSPAPAITIVCYSVNGGTNLGSTTTTFNVTIPPNTYSPTITSVSFSEQSPEVIHAISQGLNVGTSFVQNKSKVRCSFNLTGKNGAYITSFLVTYGAQSLSNAGNLGSPYAVSVDFDYIVNSGVQTVSISTTDSRGLTTKTNVNFNVLEYNTPSFVNAPLAYRCDIVPEYIPAIESTPPKLTINKSVFYSQLNSPGTYTFSYNGSSWRYNGGNVQLSTYGLTISGTPVSGDYISVVSGVYSEDGTFVRIRALYRISNISGNLKKIRFRQGSGTVSEETLPSYADNQIGYDSLKMYSDIATNSTVAFYCSLKDCFWTEDNNSPFETIVGPSFVLQSYFGDYGGVYAGKGITWGREATTAGWNFYAYKTNFFEGSYTKTEDVDGLITEKTNGVYVRYVK